MTDGPHVLVTGCTGYIGRNVLCRLAQKHPGWLLIGQYRDPKKLEAIRPHVGKHTSFVRADLAGEVNWDQIVAGSDVVIHCAGIADAPNPTVVYRVNVEAVEQLLAACLRAGVTKVVYLSSVAVYGYGDRGPDPLLKEGDPLADDTSLYDPYIRSKVDAESRVQALCREGSPVVYTLRLGLVQGCVVRGGFFPLHRPVTRWEVTVGGGRDLLPIVGVDDVCRLLASAVKAGPGTGSCYNVVGDVYPQRREWHACKAAVGVELVRPIALPRSRLLFRVAGFLNERLCGNRFRTFRTGQYDFLTRRLRYDTTRAKHDFAWEPRQTLDDIARSYLP